MTSLDNKQCAITMYYRPFLILMFSLLKVDLGLKSQATAWMPDQPDNWSDKYMYTCGPSLVHLIMQNANGV